MRVLLSRVVKSLYSRSLIHHNLVYHHPRAPHVVFWQLHVPHSAVFGGRKRGPACLSSQTLSQRSGGAPEAGSDGTAAAAPREERLTELLGELRQRLRSRAKEVQTLVRVAAVNYITPAAVLSLLDMLSTLPGPYRIHS